MSSTTSSTQQLVWSADSPRSVCEKRIFDPFPSKCCLIRLKKSVVYSHQITKAQAFPEFRCINGGHDPLQCKTGPSSTTGTLQIGYDCMHARTQASKAWMSWQENLWLFSQGPDRPHHCNRRVMGLWWPWLLAQTTHIGFLHFYCTSWHVGPITDRWILSYVRNSGCVLDHLDRGRSDHCSTCQCVRHVLDNWTVPGEGRWDCVWSALDLGPCIHLSSLKPCTYSYHVMYCVLGKIFSKMGIFIFHKGWHYALY
jgi:hypothetical protein